ncbi:lanthionine synthetase LanC family protein [Actinoplanes sp. RD1]|uniref:lanthionine synthetase LanC family protein n=1 Tax=Actinoplanes sp. RD1 TaxID=3064538 RepID=UPI002740A0EA|nr:lanthionine synthetase LanC family protein [Actinoplanes sp. RD1]
MTTTRSLAVIEPEAPELDDLATRVRIHTDSSISWYDETVVPAPEVTGDLVPEALRSYLADLLYSAYYVFGAPRPLSAADRSSPALSGNAGLVRELLEAHRGERSWLPSFEEVTDTELTLWGVRFLRPGPTSGDHDHRLPTALPMRSPGHVLFIGDRGPGSTGSGTTRLYWNVCRRGGPGLVAALTAALNDQGEPFQFKIAHSGTVWPERADVAVLYLPAARMAAQWGTLLAVHRKVRADLRPWTPACTRRIAPGLALADDPPGGLSFGQTVSRILARGLVDDHLRNGPRSTPGTRVHHMRRALAESGRPVGSTHLNPGAPRWDPVLPDEAGPLATATDPAVYTGGDGTTAQHAERIADLLADLAVTASQGCTWLSVSTGTDDPAELSTVGPELYDGLSGIAMFLAHASVVLGRHRHAEIAGSAAYTALRHLPGLQHRHGLYGGQAGAAAAVAEIGRTLGHGDLRDAAVTYLLNAVSPGDDVPDHDLVYGISGTVLAYCWAAQSAGPGKARGRLLDRAAGYGRQLAARGLDATQVPGLAHGPSSTVLALSELSHRLGGVADLDRAAAAAADHERRFLDRAAGNWPGGPSGTGESRFHWCYGAPGIAVARLVSAERAVATGDLATAVSALHENGARFAGPSADPSACHGKLAVAGAAELTSNLTGLPAHLLTEALEHYTAAGVVRTAPGLMTGAAGAGLLALRMCAPRDVPSPLYPLLPRRGKDAS